MFLSVSRCIHSLCIIQTPETKLDISALLSSGMHTSISEILKEKSLKPSRRSLPCLAQSQTHPINLNLFLSVPLSPDPKPEIEGLSQSISTSCSILPPQAGQFADIFQKPLVDAGAASVWLITELRKPHKERRPQRRESKPQTEQPIFLIHFSQI